MRAKTVNYPAGPVVAFGGFEFVKYEWRDVPLGFEDAAVQHPFLEVEKPEPKPEPKPKPKPKPATVTKKPATRRRRKTTPKDK